MNNSSVVLLSSSGLLSHNHCSLCAMIIICYVFSQPWPERPDTPPTCLGWILPVTQLQQEPGQAPCPSLSVDRLHANLCHWKSDVLFFCLCFSFSNSREGICHLTWSTYYCPTCGAHMVGKKQPIQACVVQNAFILAQARTKLWFLIWPKILKKLYE